MAGLFNNLRGVVLLLPWLAWVFVLDLFVSALLPLSLLAPDWCFNLSSALAETSWRWIQAIFTRRNGAIITVSGDALPAGESAIVVSNHVAWPDFYMIQKLAIRAGMLGRCRYFAKTQLKWVPGLGWGLWVLGMPMVSRRWNEDRKELDRVFSGIVNRQWPTWLVSFCEATRCTPKKFAESVAYCETHDLQQPQHLLYPRTKGFITTVQRLREAPHVNAVYDLTIAYQRGSAGFQQAPSMWDTFSLPNMSKAIWNGGQGYRFHVHVRRIPIKELPTGDDALAQWLEQTWVQKGLWLEEKRLEWSSQA